MESDEADRQDSTNDSHSVVIDPRLEFISDLPLTLAVEFGRVKITVDDFLSLRKGHVLELSKLAGDPLELKINGQPFAYCEAFIQGDHFAVRLLDLIDQFRNELES